MENRTWIINGREINLDQFKAEIRAAKIAAEDRFLADAEKAGLTVPAALRRRTA